ncbi:MAG: thioesterase family protein [Gammaproteobacteria bacterium]|nr:thioesterase family protein [Gammaproteobacteria bacterium]
MLFTELMQSLSRTGEHGWTANITEGWMQGRTTYGGLSAALCLQAVQNEHPDLPPLRTVQINFIGPAGGDVFISSKVMRRGKSVAYISAEVTGEHGIATHAVFCFGASRASKINKDFTTPPAVPGITESEDFSRLGKGPVFTQHFDCLLAKGDHPASGSSENEFFLWCRHKDKRANDLVALIGIADMPPPAVLPMFLELAPISSMTWMMNFLTDEPRTKGGWWLLSSVAEHARNGYSSQNMGIWNSDGELIVTGRQNVAIFY